MLLASQHTLFAHPLTHPLNTSQYTLSTHPLTTHPFRTSSQHTPFLSSHTLNSSINTHHTPFFTTQACGHHFCGECWIGTIEGAIDTGPDCLFLLCPAGQCRLVVPDALVSKYITDVDKLQRYRRFQLDSFVSQNKASSFCPAPGCQRVIEYPKRDNTRVIIWAVTATYWQ